MFYIIDRNVMVLKNLLQFPTAPSWLFWATPEVQLRLRIGLGMTKSLETHVRLPSHCLPLYQIPYQSSGQSSCNFFRKPKGWTNSRVQVIEAELTISDTEIEAVEILTVCRPCLPTRIPHFSGFLLQKSQTWFEKGIFYRSSLFSSSKCAERVEEDTGEAAAHLRLEFINFLFCLE